MAGRPPKYESQNYTDMFIQKSKEGMTVSEICSYINIAESTCYEWVKKYPEFSEAYKTAKTHRIAYYKKLARENFYNKDFNSVLFSMFVQSLGITTRARTVELLSLQNESEICTKNAPKIAKLLIKECACGNLSPHETVNLINALGNVVKMEESLILEKRVDQLEKSISDSN